MKKLIYLSLLASGLFGATRNVGAPTGNATTDTASINTAIASAVGGDTVMFAPGSYNNNPFQLKSGAITYTCATVRGCQIKGGLSVDSTRNGMTITNLVINGCPNGVGIETTGPGGSNFANFTFHNNTMQGCLSNTQAGAFLNEQFGWDGASITGNIFQDGGCYLSTCDAIFSAIHMFRRNNVVIDNNTFTHVERGLAQYFNQADLTGALYTQTGNRTTNNTMTRLHARGIEYQGLFERGEVISNNYIHKWQDAFFGSWCISEANGYGPGATTNTGTLIQNNVCDATDSVLDDLVTLHTDTTLCIEIFGDHLTFDSNQCLALVTAEAGQPSFWTGWAEGVATRITNSIISNNCFGGHITNNQSPFNDDNFFLDEATNLPPDASMATISGTLIFHNNSHGCPNVLSSSPAITTTSLPAGVTSNPYSFTVGVSGGTGPYAWSVSVGTLPTGLSLAASTGIISGTPSGSGTSSFTIRVVDSNFAAANLATSIAVSSATGITSDQFTGSSLNGSLWTLVNPVGDGSQTVSGGQLHLVAPGAALHDPHFGNVDSSVRVTQPVTGDFTAIAKFDSIPSQQYQFEGILIDQDSTHFITVTCGSTGTTVEMNVDTTLGAVSANVASVTITPGASIWISVAQAGTSWTTKYSLDGVTFTTIATFTQSFSVADIGPFVGNYNNSTPASPAFTALVDSFVNASSPDMTITMTHSTTWSQSNTGKVYTITATNSGGNATSAPVTVTASVPTGLVATAMTGTGWTCTVGTLTCTRSDSVAASAAFAAISLTVNIAANATTPLVSSAAVSGGGEVNTANDSVTDSTTIVPVVTSHSVVFTGLGVSVSGVFPIITVTDTSNTVLGTYTLTGSSASYTYTTATLPASNIRLQFTNAVAGRTATITNFTVDGNATAPTAASVFTLSSSPLCLTGFLQSTIMSCIGYMEFPVASAIQKIDTTSPSTPAGLSAVTASSGSITLTWTPSVDDTGVVGYKLFRTSGAVTASIGVVTSPSFTDPSVTKDSSYSYQVLAIDAAGNASALSSPVIASVTTTGEQHNGGITVKNGAVDFSGASRTVPFAVVNSEPTIGSNGQSIFNSSNGYLELYNVAGLSWSAVPVSPAFTSRSNVSTSLGGVSSPVTICSAVQCPAGTYEIEYRVWTTAIQASSTLVLSIGYNDGTASRVENSSTLDNSALNFARGTMLIVSDGAHPIQFYTVLAGSASYSLRVVVTGKRGN